MTVASFDAVDMYPSIKFHLVKKAIKYFARSLGKEDRDTIDWCLEMIKFGMSKTLLTFIDKFYEYGGDMNDDDRGLTIGGYESAWLADLVVSYLLENSSGVFRTSKFKGIYRDDGIVIFNGKWMKSDIDLWLHRFQKKIDSLAGSSYLQFTAEIWGADREDGTSSTKVSISKKAAFPYLDMEMYWVGTELQFRVHLKENQQLKYLNKGSAHTSACFRAIPTGVFGRLAKLTSATGESSNKSLEELYPKHAEALKIANLVPKGFPTLNEVLQNAASRKEAKENGSKTKNTRQIYFCLAVSKFWEKPIWVVLKKLRDKHGLKWLRVSMSYRRHSNLSQLFQGDLTAKLMRGVESADFKDRPCNCCNATLVEGSCFCKGKCRKSVVVYKANCKLCNCFYIGNTQQKLKKRMEQHFGETTKLVNDGEKSDSFAAHFASHFLDQEQDARRQDIRNMVDMEIVWQGDAISCMKSFGQLNCRLCMKERLEILKQTRKYPDKLLNSKSELYGACRHKTKFHRLEMNTASTDDGDNPERVFGEDPNVANIQPSTTVGDS